MLKEPMPLLTVWTSCVQYFGGGDRGGQSSQSGRPLYYFTHSHNEFIKKKIIRKKKQSHKETPMINSSPTIRQ